MFPTLKAVLRVIGFVLITLPLMPVQAVLLLVYPQGARRLPVWYHRQLLRLMGIRLNVRGKISPNHALLVVSNHVSWLDITILSSLAPVSFVAKAEIANWPFVGWLAKLQQTVFVQRERPSTSSSSASEILLHLQSGQNVVLFPEGTSSDGNKTVPFKSSLFAAVKPGRKKLKPPAKKDSKLARLKEKTARKKKSKKSADENTDSREPGKIVKTNAPAKDNPVKPIAVQTISLAYTRIGGLPIGRQRRHLVAWVGTHPFFQHAWIILQQQPITVYIDIGEPVNLEAFADRKELCAFTEKQIHRNLANLLCYEFNRPAADSGLEPDPKDQLHTSHS